MENNMITCIIGKSTKTHLYYSMKNCNKSPENLRDSITNIVDHYQVRCFLYISTLIYVCHRVSTPTAISPPAVDVLGMHRQRLTPVQWKHTPRS